MNKKGWFVVGAVLISTVIGSAYALSVNPRAGEIVSFHSEHTHSFGITEGAPQHSGGLDKYGCHNKSVPYHCH